MSQFYDDDKAESVLKEVTDNLGKQINDELTKNDEEDSGNTGNLGSGKEPKKKKRFNYKVLLIAVLSVVIVVVVGAAAVGNYFLDRIHYEKEEDVPILEDDTIEKTEKVPDKIEIEPADDSVINVLLIGEENMKTNRGRSDSMMIATINQKQKALKITSVLRDCYVTIPGHGQGKLNSAYSIGGGPLLKSTIEQNFGIPLNGYARVNFGDFETIVDKLGGVDIVLSEAEASYLNRTDYITKPEYRNVKAGLNHMNGNQVLGYSRVRKVKASDGTHDDFGRTSRQRTVLLAIFETYKSKGLVEWITIANDLLDFIYTDLSKTDILSYISAVAGIGATELETFHIPMDNSYSSADMPKSGDSLIVDFVKNNAALKEFIYGVGTDPLTGTASPDASPNVTGSALPESNGNLTATLAP